MFCPYCGSPNENGEAKCQACGSPLNAQPSSTQANNVQANTAPVQPQVTNVYVQQVRDKEAEKELRKQRRKNKKKLGSRILGTIAYGIVTFLAFIFICVACALDAEVGYGAGTLLGILTCVMAAIPYLVIMIIGIAGLARQIRTKNIAGIVLSGVMVIMPVVTEIFFIILYTSQRG